MIKKPVTIRTNMDMESRPIAHLVQEASMQAMCILRWKIRKSTRKALWE